MCPPLKEMQAQEVTDAETAAAAAAAALLEAPVVPSDLLDDSMGVKASSVSYRVHMNVMAEVAAIEQVLETDSVVHVPSRTLRRQNSDDAAFFGPTSDEAPLGTVENLS